MATSKQTKEKQLSSLVEKLKTATGVAFLQFEKLTVEEAQTIRRELRAGGMTYTVIKRTLIALSAKEAKLAEFNSDDMEGMVAVITSANDAVMPAQMIKKFKKDFFQKKEKFHKVDFAGALFEGNFLDKAAAENFANTRTKEESYGVIISALRAGPKGIHSFLLHGTRGIIESLKNADKFSS